MGESDRIETIELGPPGERQAGGAQLDIRSRVPGGAEPPVDEQGGGYGWPNLNPADRKQTIIDPQTGALIRRVSLPQDRTITVTDEGLGVARSLKWTNPQAAISNSGGRASATIRGDTGTLFLSPNPGAYFGAFSNGLYGFNYFQVKLNASINNAGCGRSRGCTRPGCRAWDRRPGGNGSL